jgi:3-oxoadipate CoA-transferase beta subunit
MLHSENGLLGVGPAPSVEAVDRSITNASKAPVTLVPGASIFDLVESFDMIRGGHVDLVLLGGFQVSQHGDLANWAAEVGGELPPAVGGAMDLAAACREVWVLMTHTDRSGAPKLVERCTYPLTASGVVTRIYTDLGTFRPTGAGFEALERCTRLAPSALEALTGAPLFQCADAPALRAPENASAS